MSQSYVKECTFCKEKIRMSDQKEGTWLAYNQDGSVHECKKKNGNGNSNSSENQKKQEITLEQVRKKLESIGIIINVERLMNEK